MYFVVVGFVLIRCWLGLLHDHYVVVCFEFEFCWLVVCCLTLFCFSLVWSLVCGYVYFRLLSFVVVLILLAGRIWRFNILRVGVHRDSWFSLLICLFWILLIWGWM